MMCEQARVRQSGTLKMGAQQGGKHAIYTYKQGRWVSKVIMFTFWK